MNYKILNKKEENRILDLEIEIESEFIKTFRDKAIKTIGAEIELKGFRKGMAPAQMVESYVGDFKIFEESVFNAIEQVVPEIISNEKIEAITHPKINVTKMAPGNSVTFKTTFTLMPDIKLADYKEVAKSIKKDSEIKVEEKEIDDYIEYLRKVRAESSRLKNKTSTDKDTREDENQKTKIELPEFNDDFVKTLGNFKNVEDFKKQLRENILEEKKKHAEQKRRIDIMEKIIADSKIDLPEILVDEELDKMMMQFRDDITAMKMSPEDYLKEIKKTEEELRKEWHADAIKRAKMNMILPTIAKAEKIEAPKDKVEHEAKHLAEHHNVDINRATSYVEFVLRNEEVFKFLENIK